MVLVHAGIAFAMHVQRKAAVLAQLLQHVIEKAEPRRNLGLTGRIEIDTHADAGLTRDAFDFGNARMVEQTMRNVGDRKSTRLNSSHPSISYAVFCLKKKRTFTSL